MVSTTSPTLTASRSFDCFPNLPVEIRCQIWTFAAPRRPRIIQVFYDPDRSIWQACKDGCGGLPSIVHVSREARAEALKSYTKAFDAYINLEEDIVFISDPVFSIRKPQKVFMDSEYTNRLRNIAFTSDIYRGLAETWEEFPELIDSPGRILRRFEGLTHFTLVLSEDGAGFYDGNSDDSDDHGFDDAEEEEEGIDYEDGLEESDDTQDSNGHSTQDGGRDTTDIDPHDMAVNRRLLTLLNRLDKEAMATMGKGYFRHVGNIHFESAMKNPDHWESWWWFREEVVDSCAMERFHHREWMRPKVSIMAVKYGLNRIGDYGAELHSLGDQGDGIVERGGSEFDDTEDGEDGEDVDDESTDGSDNN